MARISTYISDDNLNRGDRLVGSDVNASDGTKNYSLGNLSDFISNDLFGDITQGKYLVYNEEANRIIEGFIEEDTEAAYARSNSIEVFSNIAVRLGNDLSNVFNNNAVAIDSRIIIRNTESNLSFLTTIRAINTNSRTITLSLPISDHSRFNELTNGQRTLDILILKNNGVRVSGGLAVEGDITANNLNVFEEVTFAEYQNLPESDRLGSTIYLITDDTS